ncbi:hypothetical protein MCUN1_003949 [Malassezia cuniculi]|uniref:Uncharacterized protein n=1 Tax=Malassezia cuniculi TaxID=948313 RepID=A0AAF0F282_9BASI|nr:hypothetical protein MCUN1_003949 [Malassezia cuniculi]
MRLPFISRKPAPTVSPSVPDLSSDSGHQGPSRSSKRQSWHIPRPAEFKWRPPRPNRLSWGINPTNFKWRPPRPSSFTWRPRPSSASSWRPSRPSASQWRPTWRPRSSNAQWTPPRPSRFSWPPARPATSSKRFTWRTPRAAAPATGPQTPPPPAQRSRWSSLFRSRSRTVSPPSKLRSLPIVVVRSNRDSFSNSSPGYHSPLPIRDSNDLRRDSFVLDRVASLPPLQ